MKILLVSSNSGSRGGGEIYLVNLAAGLQMLGHEVLLMLSDAPEMDALVERAPEDVRVIREPMKPTYQRRFRCLSAMRDQGYIRHMSDRFKAWQPDLVHINQQVAEDGLDLLEAARLSELPSVSTIHVAQDPSTLGARFGGIRKRLARRVLDRGRAPLIAVSRHSARVLESWLSPAAAGRVVTVLNGVPKPKPRMGARIHLRERFGIGSDLPVLGAVGRLEAQKQPLFLLDVMERLNERRVRPHLLWVGDGSLRSAFEAGADARGLRGRVHVTGWVDAVPDALAAMDCLCLPSRFEGLPLALLEAMALGRCCVAHAVDGVAEAIKPGVTGETPADLAEWVDTLARLLGDPVQRERLGEAAAMAARARFSLPTMAQSTAVIYREAIDAR